MGKVFKSIGKGVGGLVRGVGDVLQAPFEPDVYQPQYPAPWAFPQAQRYTQDINTLLPSAITRMRPYLNRSLQLAEALQNRSNEQDYLNRVRSFTDENTGGNRALWNLTSQRFMEGLTPRYAGAGVLTSGPGLNAMQEGMEELATTFGEREHDIRARDLGLLGGATQQYRGAGESGFQSYAQALEGLKSLEMLPIQVRQQLISALFGQSAATPAVGPSMLQQIGGGAGMAALIGR